MNLNPETPEAGEPNLRRAIEHLPPHEPDPASWPRVAAQLAADEALARAIPALPPHEPDDDLWGAIAARLDAAERPAPAPILAAPAVVRTLNPAWLARPVRRALALAASILLLLGVFWWQQRPAALGPRETVAFSEEVAAPEPVAPAPASGADPLAQQGMSFIDAHCTLLPAVCGSGEFRSLRGQLTELEAQQAQLQRDARRFGVSPELRLEQARLITLQARITRELVQLLIS